MNVIPLSREFLPAVLEGRKGSTIRWGRRRYPLGQAVLRTKDQDLAVDIYKVRYSKFGNLTEADAIRDGFKNLNELKSSLLRFYPELLPEEDVTIVEFAVRDTLHD